ncbi:MAG: ABC transporter ATP-binding protein [Hyphomicrobiales bacterium]|nr:MAG: ABC transporter ATP-binding protein [Hyphomicrobiales bacterium]
MKAIQILNRREKQRAGWLLLLVIAMALLETIGVASIMPFLAVLGNPESIHTNPVLARIYAAWPHASVKSFLMTLGIVSFTLVLVSAVFRIVTNYAMNSFVEMRRHSIGERLLDSYLRQPYEFFLHQHSADLAKSILSEVDQITLNTFRPLLQLIAYSVVLLALVALLLAVEPTLAMTVTIVIAATYMAMFLAVRRVLGRIGKSRHEANRDRFTAASEALAGIKDIKLLGREQAYLARFRTPSIAHARYQASNSTLAQVPKFMIEAIGFGGILALALLLLARQEGSGGAGLGHILPVLGIYAFAGYRMLPAAQNIYSSLANMRFGAAALDAVHKDLNAARHLPELKAPTGAPLAPQASVALERVSYTYPLAATPALRDIALEIPVGARIGLVGTTGCGKTTLVDILLGLLRPTSGSIRIDGTALGDADVRNWQLSLGYVPQHIFLADATVAENIAMGLSSEEIDTERVIACARIANLHDFVIGTMPDGYATKVGERGIRLSGGQRQRIGIARALYHRPRVLILDEATSALDSKTEQDVMNSIYSLSKDMTIVMIAHRLSTVRDCDQIYLLDKGTIEAQGTYQSLIEGNAAFREMALSSKDAA